MKIVLVAFTNPDVGASGYYIQETLKAMGNVVVTFDYRRLVYELGTLRKMNQKLIETVWEEKPDVLLAFKAELIHPKTLEYVRRKTLTLLWNPDEVWFEGWEVKLAKSVDHFYTIQDTALDGFRLHGVKNVHYLVEGCYPPLHRPIEVTDEEKECYGADVMFAGSPYQRNYWLLTIAKFCEEKGYSLKIWGNNWKDEVLLKFWQRRAIYNEEHCKAVSSSKVCVNLTSPPPKLGSRPVMEMAMGGLLVTERLPAIDCWGFKHDEHLILFEREDFDEMVYCIEYFVENPEVGRKIGENASRFCHKEHTYEKRLLKMFKEAGI